MFEAVLTLCLAADPQTCRVVLIPGYEAAEEAGCGAALDARPPETGRFAPLVAEGAPVCREAPAGLPVEEIAPGVFVHSGAVEEPDPENLGDVSNLGFVIGGDGVAVFDTGGSRQVGESLWRAIRQRTDLPVDFAILSHVHPDHVFGASVFAEAGAEIVGHAGLPRALADRAGNYAESFARLIGAGAFIGSRAVAPETEVADEAVLDLGGRRIVLRAWPPSHTGTDLTAYDERTGTLLAGDLVFDRHAPALDGSLRGWQRVLAELSERDDVARLVPGHGAVALDWPEGGAPLRRYLDALARDVSDAIGAGARLSEAVETAAADQSGDWALFALYNPRNATVAYTELEWE